MTVPAAKFTKTAIKERESLGEKFAKKRNSLHLDIKEIEKQVRIPARHLQMIEEDNYEKLPPDVYVRGFIKIYAEYLDLEADKMIALYKKQRGLSNKISQVKRSAPVVKPMKTPRLTITPRKLGVAVSAVVLFAIIFFISWQIKILAAPPDLVLNSPPNDLTTKEDYVYVEGQTDPEAEVYINDVKIGTNEEGVFKERVSLQSGVNILKIKSKNKMDRESLIERKIVFNAERPSGDENLAYSVKLKVVIGPNPATVSVIQDGRTLNAASLMLPGSSKIFYAKEKILLSTTNAGSTKVFLNGKEYGTLGKEGEEVKDKSFTAKTVLPSKTTSTTTTSSTTTTTSPASTTTSTTTTTTKPRGN